MANLKMIPALDTHPKTHDPLSQVCVSSTDSDSQTNLQKIIRFLMLLHDAYYKCNQDVVEAKATVERFLLHEEDMRYRTMIHYVRSTDRELESLETVLDRLKCEAVRAVASALCYAVNNASSSTLQSVVLRLTSELKQSESSQSIINVDPLVSILRELPSEAYGGDCFICIPTDEMIENVPQPQTSIDKDDVPRVPESPSKRPAPESKSVTPKLNGLQSEHVLSSLDIDDNVM